MRLRFTSSLRTIRCAKCETLHTNAKDAESTIRHIAAEPRVSMTFRVAPHSTLTIDVDAHGMYGKVRRLRYSCPICEWNGREDQIAMHFDMHQLLAPQPMPDQRTRIPLD
jgi:hypothetical protein